MTLAVALAVTIAMVVVSPASAAPRFVDVIVVLDGAPGSGRGVAAVEAEATARAHAVETSFVYEHAVRGFAGRVPEGRLHGLRNDPRVSYVELDAQVTVAAQQAPTGIQRVFADANPAIPTTGSGDAVDVDVAVLDTGIDATHPDLDVVASTDCTSTTSGGPPWSRTAYCAAGGTDGDGHGTHVAGTIAAKDNGIGVVGVAPGARLWSVKVLGDDGKGTISGIVAGIDHVTANAPEIEVANLSLGAPGSSQTLTDAISRSTAAGVTYVLAAGNESVDVSTVMPAGHPEALTVSALADYDGRPGGLAAPRAGCDHGSDDGLAGFSNFGAGVDLIAPGACILSTFPGGGYATGSGTSMAAPHVAGAAALLASTGRSPAQIRSQLVSSGNLDWNDAADPDGIKEPLLDVGGIVPALVDGSGDDGSGDDGSGGDDEVPAGLRVEELQGTATKGGSSWTATVTVTVADGTVPAQGAEVTGTWLTARGERGTWACVTDAAGTCQTSRAVPNREANVTFTVASLDGAVVDSPPGVTILKP